MRNCKADVGPLTDEQKKIRDEFLESFPNVIALVTKVMPQAVRAMIYKRKMTIPEIESIAWAAIMRAVKGYKTPSNASFLTYAVQAIRNDIIYDYVYSKADKRNPEHGEVVHLASEEFRGDHVSDQCFHWGLIGKEDRGIDDVEERERLGVLRLRVRFALDELKEVRDREIVKLRYGIPDGDEMTLEQVGDVYGLSKERIRQIEARAFTRLRPKLENVWDRI